MCLPAVASSQAVVDGAMIAGQEVFDSSLNSGECFWQDCQIVKILGGFLQDWHLKRKRMPAILRKCHTQWADVVRPVCVYTSTVQ